MKEATAVTGGSLIGPSARRLLILGLCSVTIGALTLVSTLRASDIVIVGNIDPLIYVSLAKSLAQGQGLRDVALAGSPPSAHFPPGFPLALSLVFAVAPTFPHNAILLTAVSMVSGVLAILLCERLLTRIDAGRHPYLVAWTMAITLLSPFVIAYSFQHVLSEMPYLLLTSAALLLYCRGFGQYQRRPTVSLLGLALVIASSYLTRTVGLALLAAVVFDMLLRRRWQNALMLLIVVGLLLAPWIIRNQALGHSSVVADYGSAFLWREFGNPDAGLIQGWGEIPVRALGNAVGHISVTIPQVILPSFRANGVLWRIDQLLGVKLQATVGVGLTLLMLVGFASRVAKRFHVLELYIVFYVGLILVPPWVSDRNLVPILPFLVYYLLLGISTVAARANMAYPRPTVSAVAAAILLMALLTSRHNLTLAWQQRSPSLSSPLSEVAAMDLLAWISSHTDSDDEFASGQPQALYFYAGRQGDLLDYSAHPPVILSGLLGSGVSYVVPSADGKIAGKNQTMGEMINIQAVIQEYPEHLQLVYQSQVDPRFRVYKVLTQ